MADTMNVFLSYRPDSEQSSVKSLSSIIPQLASIKNDIRDYRITQANEFVGRDTNITSAVRNCDIVICILGSGGIGKTSFVKKALDGFSVALHDELGSKLDAYLGFSNVKGGSRGRRDFAKQLHSDLSTYNILLDGLGEVFHARGRFEYSGLGLSYAEEGAPVFDRFAQALRVLGEAIRDGSEAEALNIPGAESIFEELGQIIKERIRSYKKWVSRLLLVIIASLSRNHESKQGIGKGREGYIPFITWARGSIRAQLFNQLFFVDKLSQLNMMEITNGY
jgi:hypothetical protein